MYKSLVRKILFQFDPEKIHHFSFSMIKGMIKLPFVPGITRSIFKIEDPIFGKEIIWFNVQESSRPCRRV